MNIYLGLLLVSIVFSWVSIDFGERFFWVRVFKIMCDMFMNMVVGMFLL